MFICAIWLFDWYFPQFCKSDMSKYGYLEVFSEGSFEFEIMRIDCILQVNFAASIMRIIFIMYV